MITSQISFFECTKCKNTISHPYNIIGSLFKIYFCNHKCDLIEVNYKNVIYTVHVACNLEKANVKNFYIHFYDCIDLKLIKK